MREGNPVEENSKEKSAANRQPPDFRAPKRLKLSPRVPGRTERTILGGHFRARIAPVLSTIRDRCSRLHRYSAGCPNCSRTPSGGGKSRVAVRGREESIHYFRTDDGRYCRALDF